MLLAVLDRAAEPMYGYQIAKRLERNGEAAIGGKQSALYPVLRNLELGATRRVVDNRRGLFDHQLALVADEERHPAIGTEPRISTE